MRGRWIGRPGLVGTMARTAVIAGTATAVSGSMQRNAAAKQNQAAQNEAMQQQAMVDQAAAQAAAQLQAQQPAAAPAAPATDVVAQLKQLAELQAAGVLSEAEFAAAKAQLLG